MKTLKCLLALLLFVNVSYSQSVDLDRYSIVVKYRELPQKPLGLEYKTYNVKTEFTKWVADSYVGFINEAIKIGGFHYSDENPDLTIKFSCEDINIEVVDIKNRVEETKDKNGNVTSRQTFYWLEVQYSIDNRYEVIDNKKGGLTLVKSALDSRDKKYVYKGSEGTSFQTIKQHFDINKEIIRANLLRERINENINALNQYLTYIYGYPEVSISDILWIQGSKKHPEFTKYNEIAKSIADAFAKMNGTDPVTSVKAELQPSIDYLLSLVEKYNTNDKAGRKMRYSAYYNLATIYYYLDELEEVVKYGNLIITNDYDTRDGKQFIKKAEELKKQFEKNNINTRHFER